MNIIEKLEALLNANRFALVNDDCTTTDIIAVSDLRAIIEEYKATEQEYVAEDSRLDSYEIIDRYLRNNLDDASYSDYSACLDDVYHVPQPSDETVKVPEGYALVPIVPTETMMMAGTEQWYKTFTQTDLYKAMIDEAMKAKS